MLRIELIKSPIANVPRNRATVAALGLRKMRQVVYHEDNPAIRGMIHKVKHLLLVETVDEAPVKTPRVAKPKPTATAKPAVEKIAAETAVAEKPKAKSKAKTETEGEPKKPSAKKAPTKKTKE
jgi:large subunit ribosomal protein L30